MWKNLKVLWGLIDWLLRPAQLHPTFHPTSKIFDVGWNVGCIWELSKFRKKSCWMTLDEVCSRSNFSSNIFWFIQQYFWGWMHLSSVSFIILPFNTALNAKHLQCRVYRTFECFFYNQNTKKSIFKHRQLQAKQGKKTPKLTTWQVAVMMKLTQ